MSAGSHGGDRTAAARVWSPFMLVVSALQCVVTGVGVAAEGFVVIAIGLHALLAVAIVVREHRSLRSGASRARGETFWAIATVSLGPIGAIGALAASVTLPARPRESTHFDDWERDALDDDGAAFDVGGLLRRLDREGIAAGEQALLDRDAVLAPTVAVTPFVDILNAGSLEQKHAVVALIADTFEPGFAPALRAALEDRDPAVRVLAAGAAARIEARFAEASASLVRSLAQGADDAATCWSLAALYDDYANSGLLDDTRAASARQQALEFYGRFEALDPDSPAALHARVRLLARSGDDDAVIAAAAPAVSRGTAPVHTVAWYMESLFERGRYATLRHACSRLARRAHGALASECAQAVSAWAGLDAKVGDDALDVFDDVVDHLFDGVVHEARV